jgi:hypothetical protein
MEVMKATWFYGLLGLLCTITHANAQPVKGSVKLTAMQQKQVRSLATDIVSVGIDRDFPEGKVPNEVMVWFGVYQIALRQPRLFRAVGSNGETKVAGGVVAEAALQAFGKAPKPQSVGDWKYRNGFYYGYSELFEQLGLEKLKRLQISDGGAERLIVTADYVDSMATATSDTGQDVVVKTKMTLKQVTLKEQSRYVLSSFQYLTPNPQR